MRCRRLLVICPLLAILVAPRDCPAADLSDNRDAASIASQSDGAEHQRLPAGQAGGSTTLEIAPQPGGTARSPATNETRQERAFRPSDDIAALNRNFHPHPLGGHRPYLGVELEYTTHCYFGMEEHGLEVLRVMPDSAAARAGLRGRTLSTPLGDLGAFASVLLLPVSIITMPMLRRSGALGTAGDLIVAVDDQRVRTREELFAALGTVKLGDTTYITVLRPVPGGGHQTMRFALHIDWEGDPPETVRPPRRARSRLADSLVN
jgi:hypothetical protein